MESKSTLSEPPQIGIGFTDKKVETSCGSHRNGDFSWEGVGLAKKEKRPLTDQVAATSSTNPYFALRQIMNNSVVDAIYCLI